MANDPICSEEPRTLAQRMADGKLPLAEGLRCAMLLADSLRKLHDAGSVHGALSPRSIVLTGGGFDLTPGANGSLTPYTAPEALEGLPADARSDIFSFGAILYELLTGRRAFAGEGAELAAALTGADPEPSGSPALDRLLGNCLAKRPAARWPRMQKVAMELKLLTVAARRAEAQAAPRAVDPALVRAEVQQFETRLAARLEAQEKSIVGLEQAASAQLQRMEAAMAARLEAHENGMAELQLAAKDAVQSLRGQMAAIESQLAAGSERAARSDEALEAMEERVTARIVRAIGETAERIAKVEEGLAAAQENAATDLRNLKADLKVQETGVQSARSAIAQSDDLIERVVEALESLQSAVLEQNESRAVPVN